MVTLWSGLWIHVLNVFGVIKPSNQHQAPSYPRTDVFSSAKTIFFGTIPIKETLECICKLKLNTAEGKLRLRRGGWHERDRSLIFMQRKARRGKAGSRWRSRDFRNIFTGFRDSPFGWRLFWFAAQGSITMLKYKNIRKLPSHESVGRLVSQDKILFGPRSSKLEVAFSAAGFLQICDS